MRLSEGRLHVVLRQCRRCREWRSIGNFTTRHHGPFVYVSRACKVCRPYFHRQEGRRVRWSLTDQGRAALLEMAAAAA